MPTAARADCNSASLPVALPVPKGSTMVPIVGSLSPNMLSVNLSSRPMILRMEPSGRGVVGSIEVDQVPSL